MPACWRWLALAVAVLAAGCSIDRAGRASGSRQDGGGGHHSRDATARDDAVVMPPMDTGVDTGPRDTGPPPMPCVPECDRGAYCDTRTGTCVCPADSFCCAGCDTPGFSCDEMTWACECNDCRCRGCATGLDCNGAGACVMPPPPVPPADCGNDGQPCCPGDVCHTGELACAWRGDGERCRHCGNDREPCCAGGRCNGGVCGPFSGTCYAR